MLALQKGTRNAPVIPLALFAGCSCEGIVHSAYEMVAPSLFQVQCDGISQVINIERGRPMRVVGAVDTIKFYGCQELPKAFHLVPPVTAQRGWSLEQKNEDDIQNYDRHQRRSIGRVGHVLKQDDRETEKTQQDRKRRQQTELTRNRHSTTKQIAKGGNNLHGEEHAGHAAAKRKPNAHEQEA